MGTVLAGRRRFAGFLPLLLGFVLLPISLAYALLGRFYMAKMMFAAPRCNGCGQCAEHCPFHAIRMWGHEKRRPYWTFSCENCLRCLAWCPQRAVESGHSLAVVLYFVASIPASVYAMNWMVGRSWLADDLNNPVTQFLLQYPCTILSIFLTYLLFSLLIRIPAVNWLFTYTTLVHYYRRYHEPDTTLKDLDAKG
jgi:Pyruvate/2-oxoacid:ferredoxin oxidoreductase delta subunit